MDPLQLLRTYKKEKKESNISIDGDRVLFGNEYSFNKRVPTAFKSQNGSGPFYSLDTLVVFLQHAELRHAEFMKVASTQGVKPVTFQDRKNLTEYLTGAVDTVPNIQYTDVAALGDKRSREDDAAAGGPAKLARGAGDVGVSGREHERQLRTRANMLTVPNRNFSDCAAIYKRAEAKLIAHLKKLDQQAKQEVDCKRIGAERVRESVQALQAGKGGAPPPVKSSGRLDRGPVAASKDERALGIDIFGGQQQPAARGAPPPPEARRPALRKDPKTGHYVDPKGRLCDRHGRPIDTQRPAERGRPIILVPEGLSALVNMYNVKEFLEGGKFRSAAEVQAEKAERGEGKEDVVLVQRPSPNPPGRVLFEVTDRVPSKRSEKWGRVAAVICQGKNWQFKQWPFKGADQGNLVRAFQSVCGFFFHFQDEDVPELVKSWNVKVMPLARSYRHGDVMIVQKMFADIKKFLDGKARDGVEGGCKPSAVRYA